MYYQAQKPLTLHNLPAIMFIRGYKTQDSHAPQGLPLGSRDAEQVGPADAGVEPNGIGDYPASDPKSSGDGTQVRWLPGKSGPRWRLRCSTVSCWMFRGRG